MTDVQLRTLLEVVEDVVERMRGETPHMIAEYILENYPEVCEDNRSELFRSGLEVLIRDAKKRRPPRDQTASIRQICLDLNMPVLDLPAEVSIPHDAGRPLYGKCRWVEPDDLTLRLIDQHIALLEAQGIAISEETRTFRRFRNGVALIAKDELDTPVYILRRRMQGK